MDNILIVAPTQKEIEQTQDGVITEVQNVRLGIFTSKVQEIPP